MPWKESNTMDQRVQLIQDHQDSLYSISELAELYEISRETVYKWLERHEAEGAAGGKHIAGKRPTKPGVRISNWFRTGDGTRCNPLTITTRTAAICCAAISRPRPTVCMWRPSSTRPFTNSVCLG